MQKLPKHKAWRGLQNTGMYSNAIYWRTADPDKNAARASRNIPAICTICLHRKSKKNISYFTYSILYNIIGVS